MEIFNETKISACKTYNKRYKAARKKKSLQIMCTVITNQQKGVHWLQDNVSIRNQDFLISFLLKYLLVNVTSYCQPTRHIITVITQLQKLQTFDKLCKMRRATINLEIIQTVWQS